MQRNIGQQIVKAYPLSKRLILEGLQKRNFHQPDITKQEKW